MKIAWDLDDTLVYNQYRYHGPSIEAMGIITRELREKALHTTQLYDLFTKHDTALRSEIMHSISKFPIAWARAYDEACALVGKTPDPIARACVKRVAASFVHAQSILLPGARETLQKLWETNRHQLYLVTSGPELFQWRKITDCQLEKFFTEIFVVPMSKKEILRELAGTRPDELIFVDDLMKNVNHCMEVGGYGVLMQTYTPYKQEAPSLKKFSRISSPTEVPGIIEELEKNRQKK